MSLSALNCPSCGVSNINSARFCGNCGQVLISSVPQGNGQANMGTAGSAGSKAMNHFEHGKPVAKPAVGNQSNWQETAGLICGVISILLCGVFASFPGLFFSWTAINNAKAAGQSTRLGTIGIILNCIGIVTTIIAVIILIMLVMLQSSGGGGYPSYNDGFYNGNGFGY